VDARFGLRLIGEDFHFPVFRRSGIKSGDSAEGHGLIRVRHLVMEQQVINCVNQDEANNYGGDRSF
jgi:hypothetical protein